MNERVTVSLPAELVAEARRAVAASARLLPADALVQELRMAIETRCGAERRAPVDESSK